MLDMMQRMMGKNPGQGQGQGQGQGKGEGEGNGGEGQEGESDAANKDIAKDGEGRTSERRFEKKAGKAGAGLPPEFQKALDAYNKVR